MVKGQQVSTPLAQHHHLGRKTAISKHYGQMTPPKPKWANDSAQAKSKPAPNGMGMRLGGHLQAGLCLNSKTLQRAQMRTASNSHPKETAGATLFGLQCFSKHRPRYRKAPKKGAFRRDHSAIRQVSTDNSAEPNRLELADQIQTLVR